MQHIRALNLHHSGASSSVEIRKGMSETGPWTFQIVDVVFVSRASTYSLYFECGSLDLTF